MQRLLLLALICVAALFWHKPAAAGTCTLPASTWQCTDPETALAYAKTGTPPWHLDQAGCSQIYPGSVYVVGEPTGPYFNYYPGSDYFAGHEYCMSADLKWARRHENVFFLFPHGMYIPKFEPSKNKGRCPPNSCFGDPINAGTGNRYEITTEFLGTGEFPLEFAWTYNSTGGPSVDAAFDRVLGYGRSHTYMRRVVLATVDGIEKAIVTRPDGNVVTFTRDTGGSWVPDSQREGFLTGVLQDGQPVAWTYRNWDNEVETYALDGKLTSIANEHGFVQTLAYGPDGRLASVRDPLGRVLAFAYDANGRLWTLALPDGGLVEFAYDAADNLASVKHPGNASTTYLYGESTYTGGATLPNALTGVVDENGDRYSTTTYDNAGRATGTFLGTGVDRYTASYTASPGNDYNASAVITTPEGKTRTLTLHPTNLNGGRVVAVAAVDSCAGCSSTSEKYEYDGAGREDLVTDTAGTVTDYDYDTYDGTLRQVIRAKGKPQQQTEGYTWNPSTRMPELILRDGQQRAYTSNARGQVLTDTITDTATSRARRTTRTYCEAAGVAAGTCPLVGLLLSVDGPRTDVADVTTFAYYMADAPACATTPASCSYRKGDLRAVTNALGQTTDYLAYDGAGRQLRTRDANGIVSEIEYSPRGWQTARTTRGTDDTTSTDDAILRTDFDPAGDAVRVTMPSGAITTFTYDTAHRLKEVTDADGNHIRYTLDDAGHRAREETLDAQGHLKRDLSRVYDALNRLRTTANAASTPTDYTYDAAGRLDRTTDPLGRVNDRDYDPLGRLAQVIANANGTGVDRAATQYRYDTRDNLVGVTDPKGLATNYTFSGLDEITKVVSPDTGTTSFTYDVAGNRLTLLDARGKTTTYGYDALGRVLSQGSPTAAQSVFYDYDAAPTDCGTGETYAIGKLARIRDESGSTRFCYDRRGDLVRRVQTVTGGSTLSVGWTYDAAKQVRAITYPSGATVTYLRDGNGRVRRVDAVPSPGATLATVVSSATYLPFGPLGSLTFGNNVRRVDRLRDLNYRIDAVVDNAASNPLSEDVSVDVAGRVTALSERTTASTVVARTFAYDGLDRLATHKNGSIVVEGFTYDATGNRLTRTGGGSTATYVYPTTSHRLSSVAGTARTYDAAGNTTVVGKGGSIKEYSFDDRNRLRDVKLAGKLKASYRYNGRGERVLKTDAVTAANSRQFVYDTTGHLLGEYTLAGLRIKEYVWIDDQLVAILGDHDGAPLQWVETDALGTPRAVVHPAKNQIIWRWDLNNTAFGEHLPSENPDANAYGYTLNLRFPGQYYDAESGLHYNMQRDYEPGIGRYLESDPIGLNGGPSTYGYAGQSPANAIDPNGQRVEWSGYMDGIALTAPLGAGIFYFDLTSNCVKGRKVWALVTAPAEGAGTGFMLNLSNWITLHDDTDSPSTDSLWGPWSTFGFSGVIGAGGSCGYLRVGRAFNGASCGPAYGFDVGPSAYLGIAWISSSKVIDCKDCKR